MTNNKELRAYLLLSVQRALVGEVFPSLRSLWFRFDSKGVELHWIVDGQCSDEDRESISSVETEIQADFDASFSVKSMISSTADVDSSQEKASKQPGVAWVFKRRPW